MEESKGFENDCLVSLYGSLLSNKASYEESRAGMEVSSLLASSYKTPKEPPREMSSFFPMLLGLLSSEDPSTRAAAIETIYRVNVASEGLRLFSEDGKSNSLAYSTIHTLCNTLTARGHHTIAFELIGAARPEGALAASRISNGGKEAALLLSELEAMANEAAQRTKSSAKGSTVQLGRAIMAGRRWASCSWACEKMQCGWDNILLRGMTVGDRGTGSWIGKASLRLVGELDLRAYKLDGEVMTTVFSLIEEAEAPYLINEALILVRERLLVEEASGKSLGNNSQEMVSVFNQFKERAFSRAEDVISLRMNDCNWEVRDVVISFIGDTASRQGDTHRLILVTPHIQALVTAASQDQEEAVRAVALRNFRNIAASKEGREVLSSLGWTAVSSALGGGLRGVEDELRRSALSVLIEWLSLSGEEVVVALQEAAIASIEKDSQVLTRLGKDSDWEVKAQAVELARILASKEAYWGIFSELKAQSLLLNALDDFDRVVREAASNALFSLRRLLGNPLARDVPISDPEIAAFLSILEGMDLNAHVAANRCVEEDIDLRQFAHGDAETGTGNILDCYM